MDDSICVDLFTQKHAPWMNEYEFRKVTNTGNSYYTTVISPEDKKELLRKAHRHRIQYRWYEKRWARSSNYRENFFKENKAPYRCRYCNRRLTESKTVIDHIIPVAQVKKSWLARRLLTCRGIQTVNDVRNLAPSCYSCNLRKSDKMGLWIIRGFLGKFKAFWILYYAIIIGAILFIVYRIAAQNPLVYLWG